MSGGEHGYIPAGRWTGAAAGSSSLVIVSLERVDHGFMIAPSMSARFVLQDSSQASLRHVFHELEEFTSQTGISELVLRKCQRGGKYAGGHDARRLEAALELVPGILVRSVNNHSLTGWSRIHSHEMPDAAPHLTLQEKPVCAGAIAAARLASGLHVGGVKLVQDCIR